MNKYDVIYESLQNQLNHGLITMELAEEVNDLAYEKYVMESNAYEKWRENKEKEYNKDKDRLEAYKTLHTNSEKIKNHIEKLNDKVNSSKKELNEYKAHNKEVKLDGRSSEKTRTGKMRFANRDHIDAKKKWMDEHGNKGTKPEDKYEANRFLEVQKKLRENK